MADGRGQGVYMLYRKTRSRSWKGVAAGKHKCVVLRRGRDGASGTGQEFVGRWSECVGICYFQTVGSASALSEHTSRSEAVNLVSATHFHERERVWK